MNNRIKPKKNIVKQHWFKTIIVGMMIFSSTFCYADNLKITPSKKPLTKNDSIKFALTLDQPADHAKLVLYVPWRKPPEKIQINGSDHIEMTVAGNDKKTFTGHISIKNYFGEGFCLDTRQILSPPSYSFVPVITRNGKTVKLPAVKPKFFIELDNLISPINNPLLTDGKFKQAISFDGQKSVAVVPFFKINTQKGSFDLYLFQPMMLADENSIIFFIQSLGDPKWTYHALEIPKNTRKIKYRTWNGMKNHSVTSKELIEEQWVKITCTFNTETKKMELFINGESQGTDKYEIPCGGNKSSRLLMAGRYHDKDFIYKTQMLLDEFRISDIVRDGKVIPTDPYIADENTLMLLHFDDPAPYKDSSYKQMKY